MPRVSIAKRAALRSIVSLLTAVTAVGSAQAVLAGFPGQTASTKPCAYAKQLQHSPVERKRYLVRLSRALGAEVAQNSAVEEMYGDIREASYSDADEGSGNFLTRFLGIEGKQQREGGLDSFSVDCLGCHDGANAVSVAVNWKNDPYREFHRRRTTSEHPIGMDYRSYAAANPADYKPLFGNTRMVLVEGKVGCLTCHDPLNPERRHLVMSDRGSALCLTCHSK